MKAHNVHWHLTFFTEREVPVPLVGNSAYVFESTSYKGRVASRKAMYVSVNIESLEISSMLLLPVV